MVRGIGSDILRLVEEERTYKGLKRVPPNFLIGYTTREHLLLDLDNTTQERAHKLTAMIQSEWPQVGDCLILLSSTNPLTVNIRYSWNGRPWITTFRNNYHLVFDNIIGYNTACKICETLAELGVLNADYTKIRRFRGDMTLRVSCENQSTGGVKPPPEPVEYLLNTAQKWRDRKIEDYLAFRSAALGLSPAAKMVAEVRAHGGPAKSLQA